MKQLTSQYVISTATVGTLCNPIRSIQNAQNHHSLPGSVKYPRISEFTVEAIVCSCYGCVVSEIVFAWAVLKSDPIDFCLILKSLFHETVAKSWWRHQMETFSALLAFCAWNSLVTGKFPAQSQWRGALVFSLIYAWINGWVNNREAGDLRRNRAHYEVIVMKKASCPSACFGICNWTKYYTFPLYRGPL